MSSLSLSPINFHILKTTMVQMVCRVLGGGASRETFRREEGDSLRRGIISLLFFFHHIKNALKTAVS
jgi:hypothetical protein